jgi:hypothetical protein
MTPDRLAEARIGLDELHRLYIFDYAAGAIYHRHSRRRADKVYTEDMPGYSQARYKQLKVPSGKGFAKVYAHRALWAAYHGRWPAAGMDIDHLNADVHDNRPENLAEVTDAANRKRCRVKRFVYLLQATP